MRLASMQSESFSPLGSLSRWFAGMAAVIWCTLPVYADDASNLQQARDTLKAAGMDPDKHIKINSSGKVYIDGSYASSALKKAGVKVEGTNVKSSIQSVSKNDVANKAIEILKSQGRDPSKYIKVDSSGNITTSGSYAASAMKAAEAGLALGSIGTPVASQPGTGGGGTASTKPAPAAGGADAVRQAREILASKGFDVNKSLVIKDDGTVAINGSYASSALREAGISLSGVNVKDSMKSASAADQYAAASELLKSKGMDPGKYLSLEGGQVVTHGSYGASALEEAQQNLRGASLDAPRPVAPPAGGTTTPGLPPVATPLPAPIVDPTLPPAVIPPVLPPTLSPSGEILPPDGLSISIVDKEARALLEKGNSMNRADKYSSAAKFYEEAIAKGRSSGDLEAVAASMVGLGMDQRKTDQRDQSEKTYGDAVGLLQFMRISDNKDQAKYGDRLLAIAEHGLAANDLVRGNHADALEHYRKSAEYYKEGGMNALVELSGDAGRIKEMEGKLAKAGKPIPKFEGLPDAKAYISSLYGGGSSAPPAGGVAPPPPEIAPPPVPGVVAGAPQGIYGFGQTVGGDNGKVIMVTSLADSGAGTLRDALAKAKAMGGNANIKFAVEGDIKLKSGLEVRADNVTIDGYSAPGKGITIRGGGNGQYDLSIVASDVKVQNLAIRNGYDLIRIQPDNKGDMNQVKNVVIDHCSLTNSGDGAIDITKGSNNITVQWCFIAGAGTQDGGASLVKYGSDKITFANNYWDVNHRRNMLANDAFVDYRNNVVKNWTQWGTRWESGASGNAINNTFIMEPGGGLSDADRKALYTYQGAGDVYFGGNDFQGIAKMGPGPTSSKPLDVPYSIPTASAQDSAASVLKYAGKGNGNRDEVDLKYMSLKTWEQAKAYGG